MNFIVGNDHPNNFVRTNCLDNMQTNFALEPQYSKLIVTGVKLAYH